MNNSNQVRHFVLNGAVKTSGGTAELADGVFALVDRNAPQTGDGAVAVASVNTLPKDDKRLILTVGELKRAGSRTTAPANSQSFPFAVEDIVKINAYVPEKNYVDVDEFVIGYDGHDDSTSFNFKQGQAPLQIDLEISGGALPFAGGTNFTEKIQFVYDFNKLNAFQGCDEVLECADIPCAEITMNIIEQMKRHQIGGRTLGDMVEEGLLEITPVLSCGEGLGEVAYKTWTLEVCDAGTETDLALVQNVAGAIVKRIARKGSISVYQTMKAGTTAPTAYTPTLGGAFPECGVCATGTISDEGFVYQFYVQDAGDDQSAAFESKLSDAVVAVEAADNMGTYYAVVLEAELDNTELGELAFELGLPFTYTFVGEAAAICKPGAGTPISWVGGETCYADTHEYFITLPDTKCGNNRLAELQAAYPAYTITVEGENNAGCQTDYKAVVATNIVCEECDEVFLDQYVSTAPSKYMNIAWEKAPVEYSEDCKCGIRVKSKLYKNVPELNEIYNQEFIEDSISLKVAVAGYVNGGILSHQSPWTEEVSVKRLGKKQNRTHVAGKLFCKEAESYIYFQDKFMEKDALKRRWYGHASRFTNLEAQYVNYTVDIRRNTKAGFLHQLYAKEVTYNFYVEVGKHQAFEAMLNQLALAAGIAPVQVSI